MNNLNRNQGKKYHLKGILMAKIKETMKTTKTKGNQKGKYKHTGKIGGKIILRVKIQGGNISEENRE